MYAAMNSMPIRHMVNTVRLRSSIIRRKTSQYDRFHLSTAYGEGRDRPAIRVDMRGRRSTQILSAKRSGPVSNLQCMAIVSGRKT